MPSSSSKKKTNLLDPKTMDGPTVKWTVGDLLLERKDLDPRAYIVYHGLSTGWSAFAPVGAVIGGALCYGLGWRPMKTSAATVGTAAMIGGGTGMALGMTFLSSVSAKGEKAKPIPWNDEGIQQRVDGIRTNFKVRILDVCGWGGMGVASGALLLAGGPAALGLSSGIVGVVQGLSLGSAAGGLGAFGCIYAASQGGGE